MSRRRAEDDPSALVVRDLRDGLTRVSRVPQIHPDPRVDTRGGLSREDVQRTVRRHINEVRFCYSQELHTAPISRAASRCSSWSCPMAT
jgi:hypothetical protein